MATQLTPSEILQAYISGMLEVPGMPLGQLQNEFVPHYVAENYEHRIHNMPPGTGISPVYEVKKRFSNVFSEVKVSFERVVEDFRSTEDTLQIGVVYHIDAKVKGTGEERKSTAIAVGKVVKGKIVSLNGALSPAPVPPSMDTFVKPK